MPEMLDPDALLAERYQNDRPGLRPVAVIDGAIPVVTLTAATLAQQRKPIPLLDEFVLRFVGAGIASEPDLAAILGIDIGITTDTLADQFKADTLRYARAADGARRLALTQRGERTATDLATIRPIRKELPLVFDRLSWELQPYERNALLSRSAADDRGCVILPAAQPRTVAIEDVPGATVNAILRQAGQDALEILAVSGIKLGPPRQYLPVKLIVFAERDYGETQVAVAIDGELSSRHELALTRLGGAERLGIRVEDPEQRPQLAESIEQARMPLSEVSALRTQIATAATPPENSHEAADTAGANQAVDTLDRIGVRAVSVFEHPELLQTALTTATRRILIISPWIKRAVVTADFLGRLEHRLRKEVTVHIGYGIGDDDSGSDASALASLRNLQKRYPQAMTFARLPSTHAKILVFDDTLVTTSFNWLSFRGDRQLPYRMEEGTLVRIREHTESQYTQFREGIDASAR